MPNNAKKQLKKQIANYSYDEATHALFANKGQIIDYKQELDSNKHLLKVLYEGKTDDYIKYISNLKISLIKVKTTYKALKFNDELSQYQRTIKRKDLKIKIKEIKKEIKLAKKFTNLNSYNEYINLIEQKEELKKNPEEVRIQNNIESIKKELLKNKALYKTKGETKDIYLANKSKLTEELNKLNQDLVNLKNKKIDNSEAIANIENKQLEVIGNDKVVSNEEKVNELNNKIQTLKNDLKTFKHKVRYENKLLNRQRIKTLRYNNLAEEKKVIKQNNLDVKKKQGNKEELLNNNKVLLKEYKDKRGKVLKYKANGLSYYFMLLVVLLEIIYVIIFLKI